MKKAKRVQAVSIIGGADGPTSVFLVGRKSGAKPSLKQRVEQYLYKRKKARVKRSITPSSHTLEETCQYMIKRYAAREVPKKNRKYQQEYHSLRESMILREKPELLGEAGKLQKPKAMDEASLREFWAQMEKRSELIKALPDDMFPMDIWLYQIHLRERGELFVTIEKTRGILACSYSGSKKAMKALKLIVRDISLYYGVTEKDIREKTERYQSLVTTLSS